MHVTAAAGAYAVGQARGRTLLCQGTCLLEADGTLKLIPPAYEQNTTKVYDVSDVFANRSHPSAANLTVPHLANLTDRGLPADSIELVPANTTDSLLGLNSSALATIGNNLSQDGAAPIGLSNGTSIALGNDTSIDLGNTSMSSAADPYLGDALILSCPCNCTYVSAACCVSTMVWDDAPYQIQMDPLPDNATVSCDTSTGEWVPKSLGEASPTSETAGMASPTNSTVGFQVLGHVTWDPYASARGTLPTGSSEQGP